MEENEKQVCLCICLFQSCRHNKYPARKKKLNKNKYTFAHYKSKVYEESIREMNIKKMEYENRMCIAREI